MIPLDGRGWPTNPHRGTLGAQRAPWAGVALHGGPCPQGHRAPSLGETTTCATHYGEFDATPLSQPGLYEIVSSSAGRRYIGESENVLERLGKHVTTLRDGTHDCLSLQTDWNRLGSNDFIFRASSLGPGWSDHRLRMAKEQALLAEHLGAVYNTPGIFNVCRILEIDGTRYLSVAAAARALGVGGTTIRRRLNDPRRPEYRQIKVRASGSPISVDGTIYGTINEAVRMGLAKDRFQAMRRLKSVSPR